jgi:cyclophilin family peptidyl-prolyl cis-trans isomerase
MNAPLVGAVVSVLVLSSLSILACSPPGAPSPARKTYTNPPQMMIDQNKKYTAVIDTDLGTMTAELYPQDAPVTVNNFVSLANDGFYNGVVFHRIIKDFMVQTGDPQGTGAGGPGYKFNDEKVTRNYERGTLAMANAGPNTNGSQFFICHADLTTRLPKNYTIFGKLVGGLDTLDKIASVQVKAGPSGEASSPTTTVRITKITIQVK